MDAAAYEAAVSNVQRNNLADRISLFQVKDPKSILRDLPLTGRYHFVMCNPPFYKDQEEIESNRRSKLTVPSSNAQYTSSESIFREGGEVGFVLEMYSQSCNLKDQISWFTSLLGKKSSLLALKKQMTRKKADHPPKKIQFRRFQQGQTVRWVIAWTFQNLSINSKKGILNLRLKCENLESFSPKLTDLSIQILEEHKDFIICHVPKVTWTRSARRGSSELALADFGFTVLLNDPDASMFQMKLNDNSQSKYELFLSLCNHLQKVCNK